MRSIAAADTVRIPARLTVILSHARTAEARVAEGDGSMRLMRIKCINNNCDNFNHEQTIPAGRQVAPGVTEQYNTLKCDECGHDMWTASA